MTFFALAAYFKYTQVRLQVICVMIPLSINTIAVFAYNAYLGYLRGKILLSILLKSVETNQKFLNSNQRKASMNDTWLVATYRKFKFVIPAIFLMSCGSVVSSLTFIIWAGVTMDTAEGMAYFNTTLVVVIIFWLPCFSDLQQTFHYSVPWSRNTNTNQYFWEDYQV